MPTALDWVTECERLLYGAGPRPQMNRLNGATLASAATITLEHATPLPSTGAKLAVDLELLHVYSIAGQVVTVQPAMWGSTAAAHADDALVFINPRFDRFSIFQAINDTLRSLSSPANGIYRIGTTDITSNSAYNGYDLAGVTDLIDVLSVSIEEYGAWRDWERLDWRLERNMATSEFASGNAILFRSGMMPGQSMRVRYKGGFTALSALSTDVSTTGVPTSAYDLPALGAAIRLMSGREVGRNAFDVKTDPRVSQEVPAGAVGNSYRGLLMEWQRRVGEEASRLQSQYPLHVRQ